MIAHSIVKRTLRMRQLAVPMIIATACTMLAGIALATAPSGIVNAPVVARATFANPVDIKFKVQEGELQQVLHVPEAQQTVMQQIVIGPGGHTGWHTHPGPVVVLIKAGTMTFYSSEDPTCNPRTYVAGQAFVDSGQGHVHIARNESLTENLELWATYFDVPSGGLFRRDAPNPGNCGF